MDFRVDINDPAIADLAAIVADIAQDNPEAARLLAMVRWSFDAASSVSADNAAFKGRAGHRKSLRASVN